MSWRLDDSGYLSAQDSQVTVSKDKSGDSKFNAIWIDEQESNTVWRFKILHGDGIWIGVGTEEGFAKSYGIKALLYGGPGNLSDGGSLAKGGWGPKLAQGDTIDMKVQYINSSLTVEFGRNGYYLGKAFDIKDWKAGGQTFGPVVSLHTKGDCVTITKIEESEFPTAVQVPDDDDITGVWESDTEPRNNNNRYTLSLSKIDENTCRVSARVVNSMFGIVKHDGEKWQFHGGVGSTLVGIMDPELQNFESTVSTMLGTINGIERDGASLMVTFGDTTNRFVRAARPSAATKDDINWMN